MSEVRLMQIEHVQKAAVLLGLGISTGSMLVLLYVLLGIAENGSIRLAEPNPLILGFEIIMLGIGIIIQAVGMMQVIRSRGD